MEKSSPVWVLISCCLFLLTPASLSAQRLAFAHNLTLAQKTPAEPGYRSAIGLRLGSPASISFKQFFSPANALELTLWGRGYSGWNLITSSLSIQHHKSASPLLEKFSLPAVKNLTYYFGGGISAYFWSYRAGFNAEQYGRTSWGLHAMLGSEYKIPGIPLVVSLDWSPRLFLGRSYYAGLGFGYGTLAVRYALRS